MHTLVEQKCTLLSALVCGLNQAALCCAVLHVACIDPAYADKREGYIRFFEISRFIGNVFRQKLALFVEWRRRDLPRNMRTDRGNKSAKASLKKDGSCPISWSKQVLLTIFDDVWRYLTKFNDIWRFYNFRFRPIFGKRANYNDGIHRIECAASPQYE